MPEMDGYELARRIRGLENDGSQKTVLLAFTANTAARGSRRVHAAGMDDVLTKPIELKDLKAKLEQWLPAAAEADTETASHRSPSASWRARP